MKLAFITNIPSPYRVDFFNELGKYCDLTVYFEKDTSDERDESWKNRKFINFKGVFLKGVRSDVDKALSFEICKYVKRNIYDHIIVSNPATPTGIVSILYFKLKKIPYWIEGDGGFAKNGKGLKEKLKRFLFKGAKGCFSTSNEHDRYYKIYGVNDKKIFRYPFTSLYSKDIRETPCSFEEKEAIKRELGITEEKHILTVGQFIFRKGFDILLEAANDLPKSLGIYFVGGTPTTEYEEIKKIKNLENVHFVPYVDKETLKKWYAGAELMVLPTREDIWGLVVNEAMAQALPVITTDRCIAGLELVENGKNGYIVPVNEPQSIDFSVMTILNNPQLHQSMKYNSLKKIRNYTFENMVRAHLNVFEDGELKEKR